MKILIIAAMKKEIDLLLNMLGNYDINEDKDFLFYNGKLHCHEVILAQCGIGKVNSALRTFELIETHKPDVIINSGVAGSVDSSMKIGSVLVADKIAYHDVWCGPGTCYGEADNCPLYFEPAKFLKDKAFSLKDKFDNIRFGLICSGDKFITTPAEVDDIKKHFSESLACDMESASIAQTCYRLNVPLLVIRVISDMPGGNENISQYQNFWDVAPERTFEVVKNFISCL